MQAKSPIRSLDELNVTEVLPTPYFPSIMEREQNNFTLNACSTRSETEIPVGSISNFDALEISNGGTDQGFGMRRRHRCYVVTARARSFLYHQVNILCFFQVLYSSFWSVGYILQFSVFLIFLFWLFFIEKSKCFKIMPVLFHSLTIQTK